MQRALVNYYLSDFTNRLPAQGIAIVCTAPYYQSISVRKDGKGNT
jgi:hypothetical protein